VVSFVRMFDACKKLPGTVLIGLDWTELDWTELDWTELDWTELDWT
jgi:hypothetical protein